jgi:hypothetical protein
LTDRTDNDLDDDGVVDEYNAGDVVTAPATYDYANGIMSPAPETHVAKSTLETADVITMEEWLDLGKPPYDAAGNGYWVGDEDGWFYWSKALLHTDATGLLLNGLTMVHEPDNEWYYGIHVTSQMASAGDWGDRATNTGFYEDGITGNAMDLLNRAADIAPTIRSIQIQEGRRVFVRAGEETILHADVSVLNGTGDINETLVTWGIDNGGVLTPDGNLATVRGDAGTIYTVTASSAALPDVQTDTIKVIVLPREIEDVVQGAEAGGSMYYASYGDNTYRLVNNDGTLADDLRYSGDDKIIGNDDDNYRVRVNAAGVRMLGLNRDDGSYSLAGPDGDLGTADDEKRWPCPDIDHLGASPVSHIAVGSTYTDMNDVEWQVIHDDGVGHKLVMTTAVYGMGIYYNIADNWTALSGSNLMVATNGLQNFYLNTAGNDIKGGAVAVNITDVRTGVNNPIAFNVNENNTTRPSDISTANVGVSPIANGSNAIFILSIAEYNTYKDNITFSGGGWRLRSPGESSAFPSSVVDTYGNARSYTSPAASISNRPALWIKS